MLEVKNVLFYYGSPEEQKITPALQGVSASIDAGETVAIIGQNGSGKSTLAKLLAAVLKPTSGTILADGMRTDSRGETLWTIRQRVGIVFQNPDDQLVANTVIDDIAFGPENLGLPRFEIEARVQEAIHLLGLEAYEGMSINELSVGQKQRVAIAGVLAMRPRYLLLDEPTTMLSGRMARQLLDTVHRLASERGIAVIYITHFMHEVTDFQRIIVMEEGRLLMDDTPANIFARADELRSVGLDVPMVTGLSRHLRANGWTHLPQVVLSTKQLQETGAEHIGLPTTIPSQTQNVGVGLVSARLAPAQPTSTPFLFELNNVHYTYLQGTPFAVEALRGLSLSIPAGQTTALVGPTQAGKSTIVDLLAGLIKPARGSLLFEGDDITAHTFDIERIRSTVGVVFQSPESQIFEETVGKDVSYGPRRKKVPLAESRRLVQESLEAVGLSYEDFRTRYTYALSGGQKRRVAIAGVLALRPKVIVLDEPTAGLDPRGRRELLKLIVNLRQHYGLTIVYVSSSLEDVVGLADFILILDQGHEVFSGRPREILARADELAALDVTLPEAAQIALALRNSFPAIRTDVLSMEELETEIDTITGHPLASQKIDEEMRTQ
jgi:energy-coupling factor transport system ATP-binding protein